MTLYNSKINLCTCTYCSDICIKSSKCCSLCHQWWHLCCYLPAITLYFQKKENWSCKDCKDTVQRKSPIKTPRQMTTRSSATSLNRVDEANETIINISFTIML